MIRLIHAAISANDRQPCRTLHLAAAKLNVRPHALDSIAAPPTSPFLSAP